MRRYRFGNPRSIKSRNKVIWQGFVFLSAWVLSGYVFYRRIKKRAREIDPDFDNRPRAVQALVMMGHHPDKIRIANVGINSGGIKVDMLPKEKNKKTEEGHVIEKDL